MLPTLEPVSLILGAVLGAFLGTLHNYYVKRPKLRVVGGGMGLFTSVHVSNIPGFIGIKIPPTVLFGWRVHGHVEKGLVFDRSPASHCRAALYDRESGQVVSMLWWQIQGGTIVDQVTLAAGEQANLILFSRHKAKMGAYYVWHPGPADNPIDGSVPPPVELQLDGSRLFDIEISYSHGRKAVQFPYRVIKKFDGRYKCEADWGSGSF